MANKKQSKKRVRQNMKKRAENRSKRSAMRTNLKSALHTLTHAKSEEEKKSTFSSIQGILHQAAKKGLIPALRANRKISRLYSKHMAA